MTPFHRLTLVSGAAVLALTAAGCGGSALDPKTAVRANAALHGNAQGTTSTVSAPGPVVSAPTSTQGPKSTVPGGLLPVAEHPGQTKTNDQGSGLNPSAPACTALAKQTGITDTTVTIANASDITGPVPGIFNSAQQATRAFAAYFNAHSSLCGRKLQVLDLDTRTDAGGDQRAYVTACDKAFAAVGSMSAFDSGGAATADQCGLPDIRSQSVSDTRNDCRTCFGAQATELHAFQNAIPDFLVSRHGAAAKKSAIIYVREAAAVETAKYTKLAEEKRGMKFVYDTTFDVAEFNYAPYVQAMKDKGVRLVQFIGSSDQAVRMAQAMQTYQFKPDVFVQDATAYNQSFLKTGGSAVEGAYIYVNFLPFEAAGGNQEMKLYRAWLQQVAPGAVPSYFGLYAWSAARLFTEQAQALGSNLTRANLVRRIRAVSLWTDHGLHAPQPVGPKKNSSCWRFLRAHDGRWVTIGNDYICHGSTVIR
ncbi:ABC transporter substrate-binding protein [Nocardioides marmorisolisilvae]|uniref:ABC transporter substrate-binding protein n=1 Tax=Nocardioides marmorisolisilvae TaxID=1542737 RepID=A0A3N0DS95_9ACTN|nr:ABC transporter substrate-binding protein [Nocardioides marmorisolisilvae]RNL78366.1 ABC transporter substrate-binding protein [Nocardioides marmorisolisilvae]